MQDRLYWIQLHANLLNASPVDTRNMVTNIDLYESAENYVIEINAPFASNPKFMEKNKNKGVTVNGKSDYAYDVNYAKRSPHLNWVERQIDLTAKIVNGRVIYLNR